MEDGHLFNKTKEKISKAKEKIIDSLQSAAGKAFEEFTKDLSLKIKGNVSLKLGDLGTIEISLIDKSRKIELSKNVIDLNPNTTVNVPLDIELDLNKK